jgi:endonuclease/exonuclease/phosphatase (EEP) superfamily protein YafD
MTPPTGALLSRSVRPWMTALLAAGVVGSALALAWAWLVPGALERTSTLVVGAAYAGFMLRTFTLQAGVITLLLALTLLAARRPRWAGAGALVALAWWSPDVWRALRAGGPVPARQGQDTLTVMTCNVLYGRADAHAVAADARRIGADVVLVQEVQRDSADDLARALSDYPHVFSRPRADAFGQAVFSRRAFVGQPDSLPELLRAHWEAEGPPQLACRVALDGRALTLVNVHIYPPVPGAVRQQRTQAHALGQFVRAHTRTHEDESLILAGDFNCVPLGHHVQAVVRAGVVESWAQVRRGRGGTWPANGLLQHLGQVRIDHLLATPELIVLDAGVEGSHGSDHRATWARYARRPSSTPAPASVTR